MESLWSRESLCPPPHLFLSPCFSGFQQTSVFLECVVLIMYPSASRCSVEMPALAQTSRVGSDSTLHSQKHYSRQVPILSGAGSFFDLAFFPLWMISFKHMKVLESTQRAAVSFLILITQEFVPLNKNRNSSDPVHLLVK